MVQRLFHALGFASAGSDQRAKAGYRPDIDGLRAIAVVAVVLFHLDFRTVGGGFVGVDIFFVISGYLIGKSILEQRREGRFSLVDFYQKRLRRIAPALVAVLTATTIAGWFILLPKPFEDYGASLVAAVLSVANVYFWLETGYFAPDAHHQPLLHTWSLGVEEQFYILLPIVLLVTVKARRFDLTWLAILAIASLAASLLIARDHPTANFYLIHARAWELLAGVFAAEIRFVVLRNSRFFREALAVFSLAVLVLCIFLYDNSTPFPGIGAIPPVAATAALLSIGSHGSSLANRALGLKPAVWVGLISYSLYLWHWPVIVLMKQWLPAAWLRMPDRVSALVIMLILAITSWWLIERPFRASRVSNRMIWWFSGLSAALLVLAGAGLIFAKGIPQRFPPEIAQLAGWLDGRGRNDGDACFIGLRAPPGPLISPSCLERDATRPNVLILGDSHSDNLRSGLERRYPDINFMQAGAAGCNVTLEPAEADTHTCRAFKEYVFGKLLTDDPPSHVLLSLFWSEDAPRMIKPTIDWMKARRINVIIAGPMTRYELPLPQVLAISKLRGDPNLPDRMRIPGGHDADARFAAFADAQGLGYMSSYSAMCPNDKCILEIKPGQPVMYDSNHLSEHGSFLVAKSFPSSRLLASWPD